MVARGAVGRARGRGGGASSGGGFAGDARAVGLTGDRLIALIDAQSSTSTTSRWQPRPIWKSTPSRRNRRCSRWPPKFLAAGRRTPNCSPWMPASPTQLRGILQGFARHTARQQLYVPLDMLKRHRVDRDAIFAGQGGRAAAGGARRDARTGAQASGRAQAKLPSAPPEILPALLPVALVGGRGCDGMDQRRFYSRCSSSRWRPGAGNGCCGERRAIRTGYSRRLTIPPRRPAVRRQSSFRDRPAPVRSARTCARNSWPSRGRICGLRAPRARQSAGTGRN